MSERNFVEYAAEHLRRVAEDKDTTAIVVTVDGKGLVSQVLHPRALHLVQAARSLLSQAKDLLDEADLSEDPDADYLLQDVVDALDVLPGGDEDEDVDAETAPDDE